MHRIHGGTPFRRPLRTRPMAVFFAYCRIMATDIHFIACMRYVGADLFSLCREAGLNAYREDHAIESVCLRHFEKAMEIVRPSVDDMTYKAYTEMASKARNNRDRWSNTQFYS